MTLKPRDLEYELLKQRIYDIPIILQQTLERYDLLPSAELLSKPVITMGIGLSRGPAHIFARSIEDILGTNARAVSVSSLLHHQPSNSTQVLFSQNLSKNMTIVLNTLKDHESTVVFSSRAYQNAPPQWQKVIKKPNWVTIPPSAENQLFLRVQGPCSAAFASLLWASKASKDENLRSHIASIPTLVSKSSLQFKKLLDDIDIERVLKSPVVFIYAGSPDNTHAQCWKWLEGWLQDPVAAWDILDFFHGPFQSLRQQQRSIVTLETPKDRVLFDLLDEELSVTQHNVIRFKAQNSSPLSWFEHETAVNLLLLEALKQYPRSLKENRSPNNLLSLEGIKDR